MQIKGGPLGGSNKCYSETFLQAQDAARNLSHNVENVLTTHPDLAVRLEEVQIPLEVNSTELGASTELGSQGTVTPAKLLTPRAGSPGRPDTADCDVPDATPDVQDVYERVLAATRVYHRVRDREVDAMSSISTSRTRPWSVLSGLCMTEISAVAVISLPLHELELRRFRELLSSESTETFPYLGGNALRRLNGELKAIERDPTVGCSAGPIGDNLVNQLSVTHIV